MSMIWYDMQINYKVKKMKATIAYIIQKAKRQDYELPHRKRDI